MKFGVNLIVFSILAAVGYGVAFSYLYPLTPIDGGLVTLAAVLGLASCLLLSGIWKLLGKIVQFIKSLTTGAGPSNYSGDGLEYPDER
jgi:hypothetical protein